MSAGPRKNRADWRPQAAAPVLPAVREQAAALASKRLRDMLASFGNPASVVAYLPENLDRLDQHDQMILQLLQDTVASLRVKLGLAPDESPRVGIYDPRDSNLNLDGFNAFSFGKRLGPDSVVAVGERWVEDRPDLLAPLVAHELGHIATGDMISGEAWRRIFGVAWKTGLGGALALAATGLGAANLAIVGGAAVLLAVSWLLGLAHSRVREPLRFASARSILKVHVRGLARRSAVGCLRRRACV